MGPELIASYKSAEAIARSRSNFYYSLSFCPAEKRGVLSAQCTPSCATCDDIFRTGAATPEAKSAMFARLALLSWISIFLGDLQNHSILPAFHDTVTRFSIPADYFHWIIGRAPRWICISANTILSRIYTNIVSTLQSAVGLVCLQIFGFTEARAKKYAEECGVAFQLTNNPAGT